MKVNEFMRLRPLSLVCGLALFLAATPMVFAQQTTAKNTIKPTLKIQSVPNGAKVKFRGVVMSRDVDTFTIRDRNRTDYQVLLTGETSVKTYGSVLRFGRGKRYAETDLLRGLIVEVTGRLREGVTKARAEAALAPMVAAIQADLRPLLEDVRRFDCATLYVLRRHAGTVLTGG